MLPKQTLKDLSRLNAFRSLGAIVFDWAVIAAAIWVSQSYWHPLLYVLAVIVVAARQHALAIMLHEAVHHRLVPSRKLNDIIGEVVLAWPISITLYSYRKNHLLHHTAVNSDTDPDLQRIKDDAGYQFPMTGRRFALICLSYVSGVRMPLEMKRAASMGKANPPPLKIKLLSGLFYLIIAALSIVFGFWKLILLYWLVPLLTVFFLIMYIRSVAEHFAGELKQDGLSAGTRNTYPNLIERFLVAPHQVGYHLDHHMNPSVPFYNLPKLHQELLKQDKYQTQGYHTQGYFTGLVRECITPRAPEFADSRVAS